MTSLPCAGGRQAQHRRLFLRSLSLDASPSFSLNVPKLGRRRTFHSQCTLAFPLSKEDSSNTGNAKNTYCHRDDCTRLGNVNKNANGSGRTRSAVVGTPGFCDFKRNTIVTWNSLSPQPHTPHTPPTRKPISCTLPQARGLAFSNLVPKQLKDIAKPELLAHEPPENIDAIWNEFHKEKDDALGGTMSAQDWEKLLSRSKESPRFVFPVTKGPNSYLVLMAEWQGNSCLLSSLEEYKHSPALANPWLTLTGYADLAEEKGIVLLRADWAPYLDENNAKEVTDYIMKFYLGDQSMYQHVIDFNQGNPEFDFFEIYPHVPQQQ